MAHMYEETTEEELIKLHRAIMAAIARVGRKKVIIFLRDQANEIESWMKSAHWKRVVPGFY